MAKNIVTYLHQLDPEDLPLFWRMMTGLQQALNSKPPKEKTVSQPQKRIMWVQHCHNTPMTGNGKFTPPIYYDGRFLNDLTTTNQCLRIPNRPPHQGHPTIIPSRVIRCLRCIESTRSLWDPRAARWRSCRAETRARNERSPWERRRAPDPDAVAVVPWEGSNEDG